VQRKEEVQRKEGDDVDLSAGMELQSQKGKSGKDFHHRAMSSKASLVEWAERGGKG